ncbi:MAG: menaquinone biosynthesis decarboxylase [Alistipes sp.]|nr:menaquinone biosynthesis decarboxylase [Alistipes sp.]
MYGSLRKYIEALDRAGELIRIGARVSTAYEIAEITDRMAKSPDGGKALLFENTGSGFPVATNLMGSERRMAMALGVERLDDLTERIDALVKQAVSPKNGLADKLRMLPLLGEVAQWFPRLSSRRGECQQVVATGDEASLAALPILESWACDGGRFITLPMVNTVDPDTGIRNVGMYRMQIFDDRTTGMHWHRHKTGARHYDAYKARGERMPVSVALGGDPIYTYCATAPMPDNMDEYLLAGFLRRKPVRLVKCLTNDLRVPADCDFVIEGYVDTSEELVAEGDFGDHTGFYSLKDSYPRFHVTAITHRRDAVYPATVVGIPPQEDASISKATERIFLAPIRLALQPEIVDLTMPEAGTSHNIAVVSIHKRYEGQATKVAQSLWGAGQMMFNKYLVIAPHDCNVRSADELAALLRGCDPRKAVIRGEGIYDVLDHATAECGYGGKIALDLTSADRSAEQPTCPTAISLPDGIGCRTDLLGKWSALLLFASPDADVDIKRIIAENGIKCNFAAILDRSAADLSGEELLWLAAANTDPRRDITLSDGSTVIIDARPKPSGKAGNPARWPNVVTSSEATVELVDGRWSEYGIGDFIPSPSRRYRRLALSDKAEW